MKSPIEVWQVRIVVIGVARCSRQLVAPECACFYKCFGVILTENADVTRQFSNLRAPLSTRFTVGDSALNQRHVRFVSVPDTPVDIFAKSTVDSATLAQIFTVSSQLGALFLLWTFVGNGFQ